MAKLPAIFKLVPRQLLAEAFTNYLDFAKTLNFLVLKLKTDLLQAEVDVSPERYINMALFTSIWFFIIQTLAFLGFLFATGKACE